MNVDWIIPCRFVEVHDNLGTIVGAGIDTFWVPEVPAQIQVAMAVRMTALPEELGEDVEHVARNIISGPDSVLSDVQGTFTVGGGSQIIDRPDWLQGIIMPSVVRFEATQEGTYTFEQIVDQSSKSVPLHVVLGDMPGAPPSDDA